MTVQSPTRARPRGQAQPLPPLVDGEYLDQPTFHARYEAMPPETRAELVGGKVYLMSSPVLSGHWVPHIDIVTWLGVFKAHVPLVQAMDNGSTILGSRGEVQPDGGLRLRTEYGGRTIEGADGYIRGAPELLIEVAVSSVNYDLRAKKRDYEEAGVQEYVVVLPKQHAVRWFCLHDGAYQEMQPDADGIFRSRVFPGLWLDPEALLLDDTAKVLDVLQDGLQSDAHREWLKGKRTVGISSGACC